MSPETARQGLSRLAEVGSSLRSAVAELLDQECSYSSGHGAAMLHTCLFAPSLLTFWFVNGVLDFSTAVAIGAVAASAGLQVRLIAYVFVVPTFLSVRVVLHLLHPTHRAQILSGSCPTTQLVSLDWFSMGILATGLPLALQNFGPWVAMNAVFLVGLFLAPRYLPPDRRTPAKLLALVVGACVFLFANYGGAVTELPPPASVLGPVATFALTDRAVEWLLRLVNSVVFGPLVVGAVAVAMNHLLTRPELTDVPLVRYALPQRDPDSVVLTSAAFGTVFYLVVVLILTGQLFLLP